MTEQPSAFPGSRVLLAEDDLLIATYMARLLENRGALVVGPVDSVPTAFERLDGTTIDFALLDIDLKGERVYQVAEALLARDVAFFFMTGRSQRGLPRQFRQISTWLKPFDPDSLLDAVEVRLGSSGDLPAGSQVRAVSCRP